MRLGKKPPPPPYPPYYFPYTSESDAPPGVHADADIEADITAGIDITWVEAKGNIAGRHTPGRRRHTRRRPR